MSEYIWTISNFSQLVVTKNESASTEIVLNNSTLRLAFYAGGCGLNKKYVVIDITLLSKMDFISLNLCFVDQNGSSIQAIVQSQEFNNKCSRVRFNRLRETVITHLLRDDQLRIKFTVANQGHEKELLTDMARLFQKGEHTDVKFEVAGEVLQAHKCILCIRSEYFRAMFSHAMEETKSGTVVVQDIKFEVFKQLMRFIYTSSFDSETSCENLLELCVAADRFQLPSLQKKCSNLIANRLTVETACNILAISESANLVDLKKATLRFIQQNLQNIDYANLRASVLVELLDGVSGKGTKRKVEEESTSVWHKKVKSLDEH